MGVKLGPCITSLRKSKFMTQEQLALALGVSPLTVSRWEIDVSCPNIVLLCPLTRALGTNVNTLLQFEETLAGEQIDIRLSEIVETARNHGYEAADGMVRLLLHTYPSSIPLKSRVATSFNLFAILLPTQSQRIKDGQIKQKKQFLEDMRVSGAAAFRQVTVSHLTSIAIAGGELEKAEGLLKELPQHSTNFASIWAVLHPKKGKVLQVLEIIQKCLYVLTRQVQSFLTQMMNPEMTPDIVRTLELCVIYRRLEGLLGVRSGMSPDFFAQAYQWVGKDQQALGSIIRFVDAVAGTIRKSNPVLFSPAVTIDGEHSTIAREVRKLPPKSLLEDEYYKQFLEDEGFKDTVNGLRCNVQKETA